MQPVMNRTVSAAVDLPWLFIFPTRACWDCEINCEDLVGLILPTGTAPRFVAGLHQCASSHRPLQILFEGHSRIFDTKLRTKRRIGFTSMIKRELVYWTFNRPARHRLTDSKLSGLERRMIFSITARLSGAGSETLGATGKRPRFSSFLK